MRFAAIALFLGCSALAYVAAVQSHLISNESNIPSEHPGLRQALDPLRFAFPHVELSPVVAAAPAAEEGEAVEPEIPLLPKSQTLVLIAAAAARHNVPAAFVQSIVAAESNFNCGAVSPRGAIGLMQLMPDTAQQFGAENPKIPAQNIDAGTRYIRWLMNRYQNRRSSIKHVIAAYNAGPGMVDRYHGIPPFRETRSYVVRVLGFFKQFGGSLKRTGFRG
jgi:soluble lytic murein transglycosylase-like protein